MQHSINHVTQQGQAPSFGFGKNVQNRISNCQFADVLSSASPTSRSTPLPLSSKLTALYEKISTESDNDPEWAKKAAYHHGVENIDIPLLYIGDWPIIRIESTREVFTPEMQDYFKKTADLYHEGRIKIYRDEIAKGSSPLDILKKIFDYNNTLPEDFRKMAGWL